MHYTIQLDLYSILTLSYDLKRLYQDHEFQARTYGFEWPQLWYVGTRYGNIIKE
jgi:hypothetical protein